MALRRCKGERIYGRYEQKNGRERRVRPQNSRGKGVIIADMQRRSIKETVKRPGALWIGIATAALLSALMVAVAPPESGYRRVRFLPVRQWGFGVDPHASLVTEFSLPAPRRLFLDTLDRDGRPQRRVVLSLSSGGGLQSQSGDSALSPQPVFPQDTLVEIRQGRTAGGMIEYQSREEDVLTLFLPGRVRKLGIVAVESAEGITIRNR